MCSVWTFTFSADVDLEGRDRALTSSTGGALYLHFCILMVPARIATTRRRFCLSTGDALIFSFQRKSRDKTWLRRLRWCPLLCFTCRRVVQNFAEMPSGPPSWSLASSPSAPVHVSTVLMPGLKKRFSCLASDCHRLSESRRRRTYPSP